MKNEGEERERGKEDEESSEGEWCVVVCCGVWIGRVWDGWRGVSPEKERETFTVYKDCGQGNGRPHSFIPWPYRALESP